MMTRSSATAKTTTKRRRFQFSVRALTVLTVLVGLYFGCWQITQRHADVDALGGDSPAPFLVRRNALIHAPPHGDVVCSQYYLWLFGRELKLPFTSDPAFGRRPSPLDRLQAEVAALRSDGTQVRLNVSRQPLTPEILSWLAHLPDLEILHLDYSDIDDPGLKILSQSKSLRRLTLNHTELTDCGLQHLGRLQTLEDLSLRAVNRRQPISDAGIAHLTNLQRLWKLDLSANRGLTDAALEPVSRLPRLRWLSVAQTPITGQGLQQLAKCTTLQSLQLSGTRINDDDLRHLRPLNRLRTLSLPSPGYRFVTDGQGRRLPERVDAEIGVEGPGLEHLWGLPIERLGYLFRRQDISHWAGLTELQTLGQHVLLEDSDLVHVRPMRKLQRLDIRLSDGWQDTRRLTMLRGLDQLVDLTIRGRTVNDRAAAGPDRGTARYTGLEVLPQLPSLQRLELTGLEDDGLIHLAGCTGLKTLDLRSTQVTGDGLKHLRRLDRLQTLGLDGRIVTDQGLAHLQHLGSLQHLILGDGAYPSEGLREYDRGRQPPEAIAWSASGLARLSVVANLQTLDLSGLPIGDQEVSQAARLPALRELQLGQTKVGNAGVAALSGLDTLRTLGLRQTHVGDEGILALAGLSQLSRLDIVGTDVSRAAATTIYEAQDRRCRISDNWCCGCMGFSAVAL